MVKKKKAQLKTSVRCDSKGCHIYKYITGKKKRTASKKRSAWTGKQMPVPFNLYEQLKNLTSKEYTKLFEEIPKEVSQQAANWFPNQEKGWDNQKDAARHALWAATLADRYGKLPAKAMTTAWEVPGLLMGDPGSAMDLYNNASGIEMSDQFANWRELMDAIRTEAELAESKRVDPFTTGQGLITVPRGKYNSSMY